MTPIKAIIMGAAGRDFHNFNVYFRDNPRYEVVAFTAAQIPNIEDRSYPPELAGERYPGGIPILPEAELTNLLVEKNVEEVFFSYSDLSHVEVMHRASLVNAAGAQFSLLGLKQTQLQSRKPVVSICATRTGAGKSQTARKVARILSELGHRVASVRHPMPYGDLVQQTVQRFERLEDLDAHQCTIEEREEYAPYLEQGMIIFAGVDYEQILRQAEQEADVIVWDGGNNDVPFFVSDFHVVVVDPHRPGHEMTYYPGETNVRMADVLLINKVDTALPENVITVRNNLHQLNPNAVIIEAASPIQVANPSAIRGRRVLVVEDGPTLTHGQLPFGAGWLAARRCGALKIVDPRPYAVGSLKHVFEKYPSIGCVLPAMGYGEEMMLELQETINRAEADVVILGTPIDLRQFLTIEKPIERATYELQEITTPTLRDLLQARWGPASVNE